MNTQKKIAVIGATGRVGRQLVEVLDSRGHEVVSVARSTGVRRDIEEEPRIVRTPPC